MYRSSLLLFIGFSALFASSPIQAATTKSKVICADAAGTFTVRSKCKKSESQVQVKTFFPNVVQGPQGPDGAAGAQGSIGSTGGIGMTGIQGVAGSFDLDACRRAPTAITNFPFGESTLTTTVSCNPNTEYLLTYGYNLNANVTAPGFTRDANLRAILTANLKLGNTYPYGVDFTVTRIATTSFFFVTIDAVCCPRN